MHNPAILEEVLQAHRLEAAPVRVLPKIRASTPEQQALLDKAGAAIRDIYREGTRRVPYDIEQPEPFYDARVSTWLTAYELEDCIADDATAAIAWEIFKAAGWNQDLQPTTLRSQVEMQLKALEYAQTLKPLFAKQAALFH